MMTSFEINEVGGLECSVNIWQTSRLLKFLAIHEFNKYLLIMKRRFVLCPVNAPRYCVLRYRFVSIFHPNFFAILLLLTEENAESFPKFQQPDWYVYMIFRRFMLGKYFVFTLIHCKWHETIKFLFTYRDSDFITARVLLQLLVVEN